MSSKVFVKLYVNDKEQLIKRFTIDAQDSLENFLTKVQESGVNVDQYEWKYKDEENDVVTFSSQQEFEVILSLKPEDNILRIYMEPKDQKQAPKPQPDQDLEKRRQIQNRIRRSRRLLLIILLPIFVAISAALITNWMDSEENVYVHVQQMRDRHQIQKAREVELYRQQQLEIQRQRDLILQHQREAEIQQHHVECRRRQELREQHEHAVLREIQERRAQELLLRRQQEEHERIIKQERERLERIERARVEQAKREQERVEKQRIEREHRARQEQEMRERQQFEVQHEFLRQLGYDNRELNEALLRVHSGDIRLVVQALQNFR
jgi:hypothetical protein